MPGVGLPIGEEVRTVIKHSHRPTEWPREVGQSSAEGEGLAILAG